MTVRCSDVMMVLTLISNMYPAVKINLSDASVELQVSLTARVVAEPPIYLHQLQVVAI